MFLGFWSFLLLGGMRNEGLTWGKIFVFLHLWGCLLVETDQEKPEFRFWNRRFWYRFLSVDWRERERANAWSVSDSDGPCRGPYQFIHPNLLFVLCGGVSLFWEERRGSNHSAATAPPTWGTSWKFPPLFFVLLFLLVCAYLLLLEVHLFDQVFFCGNGDFWG